LARRVALELGLDVGKVQGTGIGGKIVMSDLEPFIPSAQPRGAAARALPAVIPAIGATPATAFVDEPHSPLRRAIARRMAESKASIPHFYMTAEVDATELLALRARLNRKLPEPRASLNDYLLKAVALALKEVPALNAEYTEQALRKFEAVHLGFAVATDEGLFTPVVRDCHLKSVGAIAEDTRSLIDKAKARSLTSQDLQGGTFTVSNLGMFDVVEFAAIINPPQVAILAIARPQERPVAVNGRIMVRSLLNVTVSADHRAVDGVTVAKYLQAFRERIELPERLLV
jgi:pyruvate dehydrogenase E2 component (dihydrolipoamide acetyltransferase)